MFDLFALAGAGSWWTFPGCWKFHNSGLTVLPGIRLQCAPLVGSGGGMKACVSRLGNGMTVISEHVGHVETVSLGFWLDGGSRFESEPESGLFHFIEHALFKGTPRWSARGIAEAFDGIGGMCDAYTAKEETCFSLKVRAKHLPQTLSVLMDMLVDPSFDEEEMEREKRVILEEIKMEEDNPENVAFELGLSRFWPEHGLGRPILGSVDHVKSFSVPRIRSFHRRWYRPERLLVVAVGKVDHDDLCRMLEAGFSGQTVDTEPLKFEGTDMPRVADFQILKDRDSLEQVNFSTFHPGLSNSDPRRFALYLLVQILGGGMSSRLFQKIREERGLVYHIGCYSESFRDCGLVSVFAGCGPECFDEVYALFEAELALLRHEGVGEAELGRAKEAYVGSMVMGLESTFTRAGLLAKHWMTHGRIFEPQAAVAQIEAVTPDQVGEAMALVFGSGSGALCALGPLRETEMFRASTTATDGSFS